MSSEEDVSSDDYSDDSDNDVEVGSKRKADEAPSEPSRKTPEEAVIDDDPLNKDQPVPEQGEPAGKRQRTNEELFFDPPAESSSDANDDRIFAEIMEKEKQLSPKMRASYMAVLDLKFAEGLRAFPEVADAFQKEHKTWATETSLTKRLLMLRSLRMMIAYVNTDKLRTTTQFAFGSILEEVGKAIGLQVEGLSATLGQSPLIAQTLKEMDFASEKVVSDPAWRLAYLVASAIALQHVTNKAAKDEMAQMKSGGSASSGQAVPQKTNEN